MTGGCEGVSALGACDKQEKFVIRTGTGLHASPHLSCGVHLAQLVKRELRRTRVVEVEKAED